MLDYYHGPADGLSGPKTEVAIREFQADQELPVTSDVTEELASLMLDVLVEQAPTSERKITQNLNFNGSGTGFIVSADGGILTNHHVIVGCDEIRVKKRGRTFVSTYLVSDLANDLALLDIPESSKYLATFRSGRSIRPGDDVIAVGYPLHGMLSSQLKVSKGNISALSGPGNDRTLLQTTAPVQPGSSGGPLLDMSGNVVGIVVGKITAEDVENVSFALNASIARIFLDAESVRYESKLSEEIRSAADLADDAKRYTVLVECWN
jgi:S1-C subfamily serine protease